MQRFRYHPSSASVVSADDSSAVDHTFALLLLGNPEPLIFAAFPQSEGWPFPRYLGACGRVAAFEDAGTRLTDFFDQRWEVRVGLARQLLDMTFMLSGKFCVHVNISIIHLLTSYTFAKCCIVRYFVIVGENDLGVALYLTDWSADNFAVSAIDGKLRLVDGEDLVLVDVGLVRQERAPGWDVVHHSPGCGEEGGGEQSKFCYSVADLCTHAESDLNVYGACAGLLADGGFGGGHEKGLLHGAPDEVIRKHPLLNR